MNDDYEVENLYTSRSVDGKLILAALLAIVAFFVWLGYGTHLAIVTVALVIIWAAAWAMGLELKVRRDKD